MSARGGRARQQIERIYPLTPLQQGLVFHSMLGSGTDAYHEQVTCSIRGPLDAAAFRRAWTAVLDRHGALRTSIHWTEQAQARQVVHRQVPLPWTELDWCGIPTAEQAGRLEALTHEDWLRGFDLARPPLFRLTLVRMAGDLHHLVWSNHHVILDGWSRAAAFREVIAVYQAEVAGAPAELPPAPHLDDYMAWLRGQDRARAQEFWRAQLAGFGSPTPLPPAPEAARSKPRADAGHATTVRSLPEASTTALREAGRRHGLTMSTLVNGAWALLLGRYTGEREVLFGTTVAGRPYEVPGVEQMVGLFINTLPLRLRLDSGLPLIAWLRQCQQQIAELREHEYSSLVDVQGLSAVPRGTPLFDSIVVVENYPQAISGSFETEGLSIGDLRAREQTHYPLTLAVSVGDRLHLRLVYPAGQYDAETADRILAHLERLLAGLTADGLAGSDRLEMLTPAEIGRLHDWGSRGPADGRTDTVAASITARLSARPDAVAVVNGQRTLTNGAMLARAARLAHLLRAAGAGPERTVAVCLERSAELYVTLLAVWLAGSPYLAIDPAYPAERRAYLLDDSGASLVVTRRPLLRAEALGVDSLYLDDPELTAGLVSQPASPPVDQPGPAHLAYLVYTSGTSGRPKGTMVSHANLRNLIAWYLADYAPTPADRFTQFASQSFDALDLELWPALCAGASLHVVGAEQRLRVDALPWWLREQGCTISFLPTPVAEQVIRLEWPPGTVLRTLLTGGARMTARPLRALPFGLVNNYGPAEATVVATAGPVAAATEETGPVPIGRPISDTRVYVVDRAGRLVPPGVVGELWIGGAGVARGYRGRPAETAAAYRPNPFGGALGERVYRTGDLVRWWADGRLEYTGRADRQIKLRGIRIEPGEIEAVLAEHEGVQVAAVTVRAGAPGDGVLVAYVVPSDGAELTALREYCAQRLPASLVPTAFVTLDELPLTLHGKIDEERLPAPPLGGEQARALPVTPTQEVIAGVWQQVLGVPSVGVNDDFFALGGHSLLAAQIHQRLSTIFRTELPLRVLFDSPTVEQLAAEFDSRRRDSAEELPPLTAGPRPAVLPLSSAQQRVWFFEQWEPETPLYNISNGMRLTGRLDVAALAAGLNAVMARHEALRTTFHAEDSEPRQVITPAAPVKLPVLDLQSVPGAQCESVVSRLAVAEAGRRFDLSEGPLFRPSLLRLAPEEHVLLVSFHHIVADGWSMSVLFDELTAHYAAAVGGSAANLPELPVQYADYAIWQRASLNGAALERHLDFWRNQLAGAPELLALPTDFPRPQMIRYEGASHAFTVPPMVLAALRDLGARLGASPFMVLLAVFEAVLARHSGSEDVVVGTPVAHRSMPETGRLIGLFSNTLALRTRLGGDPTFAELVGRVREVCLDAYAHQDVPFEQLVEELAPERDLSYAPLVQVACNYQRLAETAMQWPGVEVRPLEWAPGRGKTKFDLTLNLTESAESLGGSLEYCTDLFSPASVARLTGHFLIALETLTARPETRLSELVMLTPHERRLVLHEWSQVPGTPAPQRDVAELIADQAARTPDAVAMVFGNRQLTYAAMLSDARRLAQRLRVLGTGPEVPVGVGFGRSPETVTGMLAVMLAGGAYVPLDPSYPADRLAFMVRDSGLKILLTRSDLTGRFPCDGIQVICLDHEPQAAAPPAASRDDRAPLDRIAYIIYTSGSTGSPKGAMVTHRGLASLARAQQSAFGLGPASRVLQFASISFDASIFEMVMALASGGRLVLADGDRRLPGPGLAGLLEQEAVTIAVLPPTAMAALPDAPLTALRTVTVAGEACSQEVVARWAPGRWFGNLYGPTEATVWSTWAECRAGEPVTIGRPVPGTRIYVLDAQMRPVPAGVPGELHLGGDALARGYLARPGLTAERFVPDPFGVTGGDRLYRTGDRVRYLDDGRLAFLGRDDGQVKIRGFRIELGEVEAVVSSHPAVREAVVIARQDSPGSARLVAYVVAEPDVDEAGLRSFCSRSLPEYMIPAAFAVVSSLPLTPSGKVDHQRLPAPEAAGAAAGAADSPRSPVEETLAGIWAEVLGMERVGRDQSFFALGGDSMLSIQTVSKARRLGLALTPKLLFEYPTIASLAGVLAAPAGTVAADELPVVAQAAVTGTVPPTPVQRWFLEQDVPARHHYNQSLLLRVNQPLAAGALDAALRAVAVHHDALRLRLRDTAEGWQLDNAGPDGLPPSMLKVVDLAGLPAEEMTAALQRLAERHQAGLELTAGCLLRALYVRMGEMGGRLLLVIHHLAVDSISWRIILEDLAVAYRQAASRREFRLPAKSASFRAWAELLAERARSPELDSQLPYWAETLTAGAGPMPGGQATDDGSAGTYADAATIETALSPQETRDLVHAGGPAGVATPQEVLLAALGRAIAGWSGARQVTVDVESHGRDAQAGIDVSRTVGWFTSIYPLLLDADGSPAATLARVRRRLRRVPDRGLGYGLLRYSRAGAATSMLASLPAPAICFNYLGQVDSPAADGSLWQQAVEPAGPNQDPAARRPYLLDVGAAVSGGRLRLRLTHSTRLHGAVVHQLVERLEAEVRALLATRRPGEAGRRVPADFPLADLSQHALDRLLERATAVDIYPLSPLQEGMLFHSVQAPGGGVYVVQVAGRLRGDLDPERLRAAWAGLIGNYDVLRTAFLWEGLQRPLQLVHREVPLPWAEHDWRDRSKAEQREALAALLQEDRVGGFDPARAPLIRLTLVRLAGDEWHLLWTHHHLLLDGWSVPLLAQELFARYEAARHGRSHVAAPSPPYREYIAWLESQDLAEAETYWRKALADVSAATALPAEMAAEAHPVIGFAQEEIRLPEDGTARLQELAGRLGLTLSTLVNAAWALLLGMHSGGDDVVFGVTVATRPPELPNVERMVGLLIATLPLRVRIEGDRPIGEWLRDLHGRLLDAQRYGHAPLVRIAGCSGVPRGQSLFDSIVVFENYPGAELAGVAQLGLEIQESQGGEQTNYPLVLSSAPGTRMPLILMYARSQYSAATCRALLAQLLDLLMGMADDPARPLRHLALTDETKRAWLIDEWNPEQLPADAADCLHTVVERHAARAPDVTAVAGMGRQLSYGALNGRANRLARVLRRHGIGPEARVGLLLDRSPDLLVALVAVLKAGGAYVPVDPEYPAERRDGILADARVQMVLCDTAATPVPAGVTRLSLQALAGELAEESPANPVDPAVADNLAYVVYTSGSTGRPKGVQVTRRNLACGTAAWQEVYGIEPGDRFLQSASVAFDVFTADAARALAAGIPLVLCPRSLLLDPLALAVYLDEQQITGGEFVPVVLRYLGEALREEGRRLPTLRLVVSGSDAWSMQDLARLRGIGVDGVRLVNSYGISETTIDNTVFEAPGGDLGGQPGEALVPIGRPERHTRAYVLDQWGRVVPDGVPGELYVGGLAVSRGYLDRPGLTAGRFLPDPFGPPGSRCYRTGDGVRRRPDGNLEFLGRLDDQVKLRGVRIEPGEVEAVLVAHPAVLAAAAVVSPDTGGDPRLAGFVVVRSGEEWSSDLAAELRALAASQLPAALVPSALVPLDALPTTTNGKVDRAALAGLVVPAPAGAQERYEAPGTPAEMALSRVWADVLGLERVGAADGFFALGGDSIMSLQVVTRARAAGWVVTPQQVFQQRTVRGLAAVAVTVDAAAPVLAEQGIVTGAMPPTPIQAEFLADLPPAPHHFNQALLLRTRGPMDLPSLEWALRIAVRHHDALRLRVADLEGAAEGVRPPSLEQAGLDGLPPRLLTVVDLSALRDIEPGREVERLAASVHASLDLAAGCLLRAVYFDFGADRPGRLLLVIHHLVVDGVSWRIILEDLQEAYQQALAGDAEMSMALRAKTTAFRDWARHLHRSAQTDEIGAQVDYWLGTLRAGARSVVPLDLLPAGDESLESVNTRADTASVRVRLDSERTRTLLRDTPAAFRARIDEVLLTGTVLALIDAMDERRVLVDLEGHGRDDVPADLDVSRTVGWFTTVYPVLFDVVLGASPAGALRQVREQLRRVPGNGLGYGLLRYLRTGDPVASSFADLPSAAVCFNYLGQLDGSFQPGGLWEPAPENPGPGQDRRAGRRYLIEVDAFVLAEELTFTWTYSRRLHHEHTVAGWAEACLGHLRTLISEQPAAGDDGGRGAEPGSLTSRELAELLGQFS
jgi:amino acid adenylation domain-containing protein/non-ribosomal peptide synthase protein (TIGR01720 family)